MKDALGHGSNGRGGLFKPLKGHPYHGKSDAELRYIIKDAGAAAQASRGLSAYNPNSGKREDTEGKYLDQVNDASTVLGYRDRGGRREVSANAEAAESLASTLKSTMVPVHDSMARSPGQSDRSYITQRLTDNASKSAGMERAPGESNAAYIRRRVS